MCDNFSTCLSHLFAKETAVCNTYLFARVNDGASVSKSASPFLNSILALVSSKKSLIFRVKINATKSLFGSRFSGWAMYSKASVPVLNKKFQVLISKTLT